MDLLRSPSHRYGTLKINFKFFAVVFKSIEKHSRLLIIISVCGVGMVLFYFGSYKLGFIYHYVALKKKVKSLK